ncbi:MAG TPA: protein kinase [Sandaracinaceae bacterium LLY-WYZ-13_1]|nr:protein kinase [Sandaracinaceae bacterium LLY-WYZ-13_1]
MSVLDKLERAAEQGEDDRYLLLEKLGQGGMGQVWLAEKLGPNGEPLRTVVLKTVIPQGSPEELARRYGMFMREMAIAFKLEHRNIVRVTDWGSDLFGSDHYFEMERIKGISLLALLAARGVPLDQEKKWGPLPPQDVAWIGMQAAAGLHYAHNFARTGEDDTEGGVAHRDVTPDNIMVDIDGEVKITDFGIAKTLNAAGDASRTGMVAGKVKYMAPEQIRGQIDARADVYGLGVTLAVALSGKPVFPSGPNATWETIALRVLQGERPPVRELAPDAPPALQDLLERMMQVDREQRPRTAGELVEPFKDIAVALGGDLYAVQQDFAKRVREHHKEGRRTKRAVQAAHQNVPSKSTRRPITPVTQPDRTDGSAPVDHTRPLGAAPPLAASTPSASTPQTVELSGSSPDSPAAPTAAASAPHPSASTAEAAPASSQRTLLLAALGASVLLLLALLAGTAAFMLGGMGEEPTAAPEAPQTAPGAPEAPTSEAQATPSAAQAREGPAASEPPSPTAAAATEATEEQDSEAPSPPPAASESEPATPPEPGRLTVIAIPHGPIRLDNRRIAGRNQTRTTVSLPAGRHTVVAGTGSERTRCPITIRPGRHHTLEIDELERRCR